VFHDFLQDSKSKTIRRQPENSRISPWYIKKEESNLQPSQIYACVFAFFLKKRKENTIFLLMSYQSLPFLEVVKLVQFSNTCNSTL